MSRKMEAGKSSRTERFIKKSDELAAQEHQAALDNNKLPYRREDRALWKKLPFVSHPVTGLPMPRKAIKTFKEGRNKFADFFLQFQFGLWGYRQRAYPPEKPFDVQQVMGTKFLEARFKDFALRGGNFYYKDRLGRTRGPMEVLNMKTAWAAGIIDKNTFVWGDDMDEWAPVGMVYGLKQAIATPDVQLAALGTALVHKVARGFNPFQSRKGYEKTSYKQLQEEALAKRAQESEIVNNNGGFWPGNRVPSHVLGMWAGGSQLTSLLESNEIAPDRFIPYEVRKKLAEEIPGLRPWEVREVEAIFDFITFQHQFWRVPLGAFSTRPRHETEFINEARFQHSAISEEFQEALMNFKK